MLKYTTQARTHQHSTIPPHESTQHRNPRRSIRIQCFPYWRGSFSSIHDPKPMTSNQPHFCTLNLACRALRRRRKTSKLESLNGGWLGIFLSLFGCCFRVNCVVFRVVVLDVGSDDDLFMRCSMLCYGVILALGRWESWVWIFKGSVMRWLGWSSEGIMFVQYILEIVSRLARDCFVLLVLELLPCRSST